MLNKDLIFRVRIKNINVGYISKSFGTFADVSSIGRNILDLYYNLQDDLNVKQRIYADANYIGFDYYKSNTLVSSLLLSESILYFVDRATNNWYPMATQRYVNDKIINAINNSY